MEVEVEDDEVVVVVVVVVEVVPESNSLTNIPNQLPWGTRKSNRCRRPGELEAAVVTSITTHGRDAKVDVEVVVEVVNAMLNSRSANGKRFKSKRMFPNIFWLC